MINYLVTRSPTAHEISLRITQQRNKKSEGHVEYVQKWRGEDQKQMPNLARTHRSWLNVHRAIVFFFRTVAVYGLCFRTELCFVRALSSIWTFDWLQKDRLGARSGVRSLWRRTRSWHPQKAVCDGAPDSAQDHSRLDNNQYHLNDLRISGESRRQLKGLPQRRPPGEFIRHQTSQESGQPGWRNPSETKSGSFTHQIVGCQMG